MEQKTVKATLAHFAVDQMIGLDENEVSKRQAEYGKNELPRQKKKTIFSAFLGQMNNAMIYILLIAAVISFVMAIIEKSGSYFEPILILTIVLINGIIGTIQELKADKALEALEKLSSPTTVVRRAGEIKEIKASELVPGDIVILEEGRTIPADLRLLTSINLKVSEASLTGESVPVEKDAHIVYSQIMPIGDRKNIVYMSTPVVYGRGEGVVISTGLKTEIGQIASMLSSTKQEETPLQKRLADLSKLLGIITLVLVALLFVIALIKEPSWENVKNMFLLSISLAVAAVPEGLPAVVTITLALGVQRMVKVNTITRRLPSVETLGAVSVICSDKTGTLTQNVMTVVSAYTNEATFETAAFSGPVVSALADGLALCSNASVDHGIYGDPTEIALVNFANVFDHHKDDLETKLPRVLELPFDSVRKMMSTLHEVKKDTFRQYTKGAMDNILKLSTHILIDGKIRPITSSDKENINKAAAVMATRALRVLALAQKEVNQQVINEDNLVFVGLVGMVDPARPEAVFAVKNLKDAGIVTIMITGDHADTAFAIAEELGIASERSQVMTGAELDQTDETTLRDVLLTKRVFARVSPQNKVQIVNALQAHGEIVAMTGDGVNDAPSLKTADIGIAMGITGTDVAKGASDMVLTDDNFASIEKAVQEGRGIYANIKKTVWFLLSSNFGEIITMLAAILIGLPWPLTALHILWVNLITDGIPALALGSDTKDPDIMKEKPRAKSESLFANGGYLITIVYGFVIALITTLAFLYVPVVEQGARSISEINTVLSNQVYFTKAQTFAFTTLGVSQLFHMFGMSNLNRSFFKMFVKDKWFLWVAFLAGFLLQISVTEIHILTLAFGTIELTFMEWFFLALLSTTPLVIHELRVLVRFLKKRFSK